MESAERLDAGRTCLLLFDFLVGHVRKDAATRERYVPVVANAAKLLALARAGGAMVAYARADHRADRATHAPILTDSESRPPLITGGTPEAEIIPELAPRHGEYLVPKHRWSAFHGTYLDIALRTRGADTLVLCGGTTEIGIASTAYAARDLGYHLVIAADACTSPKRDVHEQLMREVFPRLARVRTTGQVLEMLQRV
ncbi:MAG: isochorismatase [Betaproteobacteria bacterium RIFCSPLOWO2_12_FULL_65_14]|nr:MAG: isochorismatase [Betaproteobacteria bacterium RIFCSPLOWO2_12_FULL_65_14]